MTVIPRRAMLGGLAAAPFLPRIARAAKDVGTLRFGLSSYPPNLLPWASVGTAALTVKTQIHRGLLSFGPDAKIRGELAEFWERDGDAGWLFHLRDATFHNGAPVTAEDVKWSFAQITGDKSSAYLRGQLSEIQSIETPDARTVRIAMKAPAVTLPSILATPFASVIARDSLSAEGGPVGAGPYMVKGQERGVSIDLVAFDKFHRPGRPRTPRIRMLAYADENARVAALQAGDVDMIEYVPWQSMEQIEADPKLKLDTVDGPFMAIDFNGGAGPFKDARLRAAVSHAIRREEVVKAAFFGRGTVLEGLPIAAASEFHNEAYAHGWKYDPGAAKRLMAEAGVTDGFPCTLLSTAQYGMHSSTAQIVQQHLGEIGIQVTLNMPDWPTRVALGNRGQYEFCIQGQAADNNDPDGLSAYIDGDLPPDNSRSGSVANAGARRMRPRTGGDFKRRPRRTRR